MRTIIYGAYDTEQNKIIFKSAHYSRVKDFIEKSDLKLKLISKFRSF